MKIIGIDIGSSSLKVAEVEVGSGKSHGVLTNFQLIPLNPDIRSDRQLELIEALRHLISQYQPGTARFIVGLSQSRVSLRAKQFPFRERPKILKSLAFELEDDIPLEPDETIFEIKLTGFHGNSAEVLALACPNDVVQTVLNLCRDGGFEPEIVSTDAMALSNIYENWSSPAPLLTDEDAFGSGSWGTPDSDDKEGGPSGSTSGSDGSSSGSSSNGSISSANSDNANNNSNSNNTDQSNRPAAPGHIVLHMGHTHTLLLAYRQQRLIFARSIAWGGFQAAEALARTFNVSFSEGVKILEKKGFILMNSAGATPEQRALSETMASQVDHLIRDARFTMLDLQIKHNVRFTRIDLLGGVSQILNLAPYITQNLEVAANLPQNFEGSIVSSETMATRVIAGTNISIMPPSTSASSALASPLIPLEHRIDLTREIQAVWGVALGLAIEGLRKPRNPAVNFRKGPFIKENKSNQIFWERWRPSILAATTAFALFCIYSFTREMLATTLVESVETNISEQAAMLNLPKSQRSVEGVRAYVTQTKKKVQNKKQLDKLNKFNSPLEIINQISSLVPLGETVGGTKLASDITRLMIENENVLIEGHVQNEQQVAKLKGVLERISIPQSLELIPSATANLTAQNKSNNETTNFTSFPFAFKFRVQRYTDKEGDKE